MAVLAVALNCRISRFGEERRREEEGSIGDLKFESDVWLCSVYSQTWHWDLCSIA